MPHSIKVTEINEGQSLVDNTSFIHALVEVYNDEVSLGKRSFSYPIGTTPEDIKADLEKVAATLDSDAEISKKSAELEESLKSIKVADEALTGLEINNN